MLKLNVGCGTDYREGYVNIDGSESLHKVDRVIRIGHESLLDHFSASSVDFILANDIVEHHFRWQGIDLMKQFFCLLKNGGKAQIRVPDTEYLIRTWRYSIKRKILFLYGGQDIALGLDPEMDKSRLQHPEFFCHKYGWTQKSMSEALKEIGFKRIRTSRSGTNFVATAEKQ